MGRGHKTKYGQCKAASTDIQSNYCNTLVVGYINAAVPIGNRIYTCNALQFWHEGAHRDENVGGLQPLSKTGWAGCLADSQKVCYVGMAPFSAKWLTKGMLPEWVLYWNKCTRARVAGNGSFLI